MPSTTSLLAGGERPRGGLEKSRYGGQRADPKLGEGLFSFFPLPVLAQVVVVAAVVNVLCRPAGGLFCKKLEHRKKRERERERPKTYLFV